MRNHSERSKTLQDVISILWIKTRSCFIVFFSEFQRNKIKNVFGPKVMKGLEKRSKGFFFFFFSNTHTENKESGRVGRLVERDPPPRPSFCFGSTHLKRPKVSHL